MADISLSRQLVLALIDEIEIIRADLEHVATSLCNDADFVARNMDTMQRFDELAQRQDIIAHLLKEGGCKMSVEKIKLEAVRNRILERLNTRRVA